MSEHTKSSLAPIAPFRGEMLGVRGEQAASSIPYVPFDGICLTDTFQMYEGNDMLDVFFPDNSERRKRQKKLDIRVIVGNPPYSVGQKSENDNAPNLSYSVLDARIKATYATRSSAVLQKGIYDSYVRAIRWASDRLCKYIRPSICFVFYKLKSHDSR